MSSLPKEYRTFLKELEGEVVLNNTIINNPATSTERLTLEAMEEAMQKIIFIHYDIELRSSPNRKQKLSRSILRLARHCAELHTIINPQPAKKK